MLVPDGGNPGQMAEQRKRLKERLALGIAVYLGALVLGAVAIAIVVL